MWDYGKADGEGTECRGEDISQLRGRVTEQQEWTAASWPHGVIRHSLTLPSPLTISQGLALTVLTDAKLLSIENLLGYCPRNAIRTIIYRWRVKGSEASEGSPSLRPLPLGLLLALAIKLNGPVALFSKFLLPP